MTTEEWNKVKKEWEMPYYTIKIECDGYKLSLEPHIYKCRLIRSVFIDGWFKGEWLDKDNEMAKRFLRIGEHYVHSQKDRNEFLKTSGKRLYNRFNMDKKYTAVYPDWTSFLSFKRHIVANNQEIKYIAE